MNNLEYQAATRRTLSLKFETGIIPHELLHSVIGISTEAFELYEATSRWNILEECGDIAWYLATGYDALGLEFPENALDNCGWDLDESVGEILRLSAQTLDFTKKALFYGKNTRHEILNGLNAINDALENVFRLMEIKREVVFEANILKLATRYPEKFTGFFADNRDLAAERMILEEKLK